MTKTTWIEAYDPFEMLDLLRHCANDIRLWGYVRRCLSGVGAEAAVDILNAYIAGDLDEASFFARRHEFEMIAGQRAGGGYSMGRKPVRITRAAQQARAALAAFQTSAWSAAEQVTQETRHELQRCQCAWLRCLFADPSRDLRLDPRWLNPTVTTLVRVIDKEDMRDLMPILGDALIDTGCDNETIIQHCQDSEEHTRDCWVVALLLGMATHPTDNAIHK